LKPNGTSNIWAKERKNQKRENLGHNKAKSENKSYIYEFVRERRRLTQETGESEAVAHTAAP
jgi:hypothetical protein